MTIYYVVIAYDQSSSMREFVSRKSFAKSMNGSILREKPNHPRHNYVRTKTFDPKIFAWRVRSGPIFCQLHLDVAATVVFF